MFLNLISFFLDKNSLFPYIDKALLTSLQKDNKKITKLTTKSSNELYDILYINQNIDNYLDEKQLKDFISALENVYDSIGKLKTISIKTQRIYKRKSKAKIMSNEMISKICKNVLERTKKICEMYNDICECSRDIKDN